MNLTKNALFIYFLLALGCSPYYYNGVRVEKLGWKTDAIGICVKVLFVNKTSTFMEMRFNGEVIADGNDWVTNIIRAHPKSIMSPGGKSAVYQTYLGYSEFLIRTSDFKDVAMTFSIFPDSTKKYSNLFQKEKGAWAVIEIHRVETRSLSWQLFKIRQRRH